MGELFARDENNAGRMAYCSAEHTEPTHIVFFWN